MTQECLRYFCKRYLLFVLTYRLGVLAVVQDSWGEVLDKNRLADDPSHKELTHIISSWPNQVTTLSVAMLSRLRAQFKLTVKLHHWTLTRLVWEEAMTMWQFASTHSCGAQHAPYKPSQTLAAAILANEETMHGAWVLYDRLHLVMGEMLLGTGKKHGRKGQSPEHGPANKQLCSPRAPQALQPGKHPQGGTWRQRWGWAAEALAVSAGWDQRCTKHTETWKTSISEPSKVSLAPSFAYSHPALLAAKDRRHSPGY